MSHSISVDTLETLYFRFGFRHQDRYQVFSIRPVERIMPDVARTPAGELREFYGQACHVHPPGRLPPAIAIAWHVNSLTDASPLGSGTSTRTCAPTTIRPSRCSERGASPGRRAASISVLSQYIQQQDRPV